MKVEIYMKQEIKCIDFILLTLSFTLVMNITWWQNAGMKRLQRILDEGDNEQKIKKLGKSDKCINPVSEVSTFEFSEDADVWA